MVVSFHNFPQFLLEYYQTAITYNHDEFYTLYKV
jgi:hypothetical protein